MRVSQTHRLSYTLKIDVYIIYAIHLCVIFGFGIFRVWELNICSQSEMAAKNMAAKNMAAKNMAVFSKNRQIFAAIILASKVENRFLNPFPKCRKNSPDLGCKM